MSDNNKQKQDTAEKGVNKAPKNQNNKEKKKELTLDEKLKETEEKLLRSLAEIENQRRRFEKEIKDAFEFGSFNFAKESLAILDNLQRAKDAIKNDEKLKDNKDNICKTEAIPSRKRRRGKRGRRRSLRRTSERKRELGRERGRERCEACVTRATIL